MKIVIYWQRLPKPVRAWLKGLEVAVVTGVVSGAATYPFADFTSKAGVSKFVGGVVFVAGGCVRLYLAQSPIQTVVQEVVAQKTTVEGTETVRATTST